MPEHDPRATGVRSRWWIVAALFMTLGLSSGLGFYNLSVYMAALVAAHGLPVAQVSGATTAFFLASGCGGMGVAALIARLDLRLVVVAGAAVGAAALWLIGQAATLAEIYAAHVLFGVAYAAVGLVPATTLIARWFVDQRAFAMSLASTGLSVGGIVVTPASAAAIADHGLAATMPTIALVFLVGIALPALLLRPWPGPAATAATGSAASAAAGGLAAAAARRTVWFAAVTAAYALVMLAQVGGIAHLYSLALERVGETTAGAAVATLAACSVVGRLSGGVLVGRVDVVRFIRLNMVIQLVGLAALALADGHATVLVAAGCFGLGIGNLLMLQPLVLVETFGVREFPRIYSFSQACSTLGVAAGPAVLGLIHDRSGDYRAAFATAALASVLALVVIVYGERHRVDWRSAPVPAAEG